MANNHKKTPKYIIIAEKILNYLKINNYQENDRIPGGRFFVKQFDTSKTTVYEAFGYLEDKKIIQSMSNKGFILKCLHLDTISGQSLINWNSYVKYGWIKKQSKEFRQIYADTHNKKMLNLNVYALNSYFEYDKVILKSMENIINNFEPSILNSYNPLIINSLYNYILKDLFGNLCTNYTDNILLSNNKICTIDIILQTLASQGDTLYIENPSSIPLRNMAASIGLNIIYININEDGLDINDLRKKYKKTKHSFLLLSSRGHAVTNTVNTESKCREIIEICNLLNIIVLEVDNNSIFAENSNAVIKKYDTENRVIYMSSIMFPFTIGIDIYWIIAPKEIIPYLQNNIRRLIPFPNNLIYYILENMLTKEYYKNFRDKVKQKFIEYNNVVHNFINTHLSAFGKLCSTVDGYSIWYKINDDININSFYKELYSNNVSVFFGSFFGAEYTRYISMFPYYLSKDELQYVLHIIKKALTKSKIKQT